MENRTPAPREDQRVRLTKTLLQNAFLELLTEKPVQSVTVKELCQRAGVNRGTFYLHYKDVYDLLEKMEDALLRDLDELLQSNPVIVYNTPEEAGAGFTNAIFGFFEKNREMCAILLGDNGDKKFVAGIIERAKEKSVREYLAFYPTASRQDAEIFYYFIAWGFIGLLQQSLQNPPPAPFGTMAAAAQRIIMEAARFFAVTD
ncbi:TetR/AcrR family transcriptional regulator [Ruminococcaceae bacterium OttesenSCG-928-O06]|nr:TetR/AcrR family transcriptional regulator [Ruminococcaceae bacterium OttesenSCG-928-O06]